MLKSETDIRPILTIASMGISSPADVVKVLTQDEIPPVTLLLDMLSDAELLHIPVALRRAVFAAGYAEYVLAREPSDPRVRNMPCHAIRRRGLVQAADVYRVEGYEVGYT